MLAERWRTYKRDGDRRARDDLILAYSPIVKYLAGRVASRLPSHIEAAELVSDGFKGLMTAVEHFDPQRGTRFEAYADRRIRGAMVDGMRSLDWVPRQVRDEARQIERATAGLTMEKSRLPTDVELARSLSLTGRQLNAALQRISEARVLALDEPLGAELSDGHRPTLLDSLPDRGAVDPAASAQGFDRRRHIRAAIRHLSARDQMIFGLYYYQELTFVQIAEVLGISASRVSQLHTRAALRLRVLLAPAASAAQVAGT